MVKSITVYRHKTFFRKMELAITVGELQKGLLGRTTAGRGLFLMGADAIHTYGMKFPIDVVYLNSSGLIIAMEEKLLPNRQGGIYAGAAHVVEFNPGTIKNYRIKVGEQWYWKILD